MSMGKTNLTLYFALRDLKGRFAGSMGGIAWMILQPVGLMLLFIFVFSTVMRIKLGEEVGTRSFALFLIAGLLPWLALQEGISRASSSLLENSDIVKKLYFPLSTIPSGLVLSSFIYHFAAYLLFLAVYVFYLALHGNFSLMRLWGLFYLLPIVGVQGALTVGLGYALAALAVYIRDIGQLLPLLLQVWFYITPVVYPISLVPERYLGIIRLNPATGLIDSYREVILKGTISLDWGKGWTLIFSMVVLVMGVWIFNRLKDGFGDVL